MFLGCHGNPPVSNLFLPRAHGRLLMEGTLGCIRVTRTYANESWYEVLGETRRERSLGCSAGL